MDLDLHSPLYDPNQYLQYLQGRVHLQQEVKEAGQDVFLPALDRLSGFERMKMKRYQDRYLRMRWKVLDKSMVHLQTLSPLAGYPHPVELSDSADGICVLVGERKQWNQYLGPVCRSRLLLQDPHFL